ncbi:Hypothetical predicted protein [Octopus vulgaris]|uniref:Uncharacterized protein n=1 Tax=Octopus vulgaris TaxID=6645 RepID=A0AA36F5A7_OCTVU|nr:Hypothetical predicted protein [Octopus vulgaris]
MYRTFSISKDKIDIVTTEKEEKALSPIWRDIVRLVKDQYDTAISILPVVLDSSNCSRAGRGERMRRMFNRGDKDKHKDKDKDNKNKNKKEKKKKKDKKKKKKKNKKKKKKNKKKKKKKNGKHKKKGHKNGRHRKKEKDKMGDSLTEL